MIDMKTYAQRKEVLESQIADIESHIKWEGIPAFVFISALSGLVWAFVQIKGFIFADFSYVILISIIASRDLWKLIQPDFFSFQLPNEDDVKVVEIFKKNATADSFLDLALSFIGIWCVYLIESLYWAGFIYFGISITFNLLAIVVLRFIQAETKKNKLEHLKKIPNSWLQIIPFLYQLAVIAFIVFGLYLCMEAFQGVVSNLTSIKGLLIMTGGLLLIKFYSKGRYWFTALEVRRHELTNLIRNQPL